VIAKFNAQQKDTLGKFLGHPAVTVLDASGLVYDSARGRDGGPGKLHLAVPDNIVKNLRGDPGRRDKIILVHVEHWMVSSLQSGILPAGTIIKP